MSKTLDAFRDGKAFIPFITAGDPDGDMTVKYILAMADAGADLIEVGIPFSDPTAEGPVIQEADAVALKNGMTVSGAFEVVEKVREKKPDLPLAFMTYVNPVFQYKGKEYEEQVRAGHRPSEKPEPYVPFFKRCKEDGIDALILADVPFEEQDEVLDVSDRYGVDLISMVSPTSEERIRTIAKNPRGFIYVVSSMGVTGVRSEFQYDTIEHMVHIIREANPEQKCAVGFGISNPEQAEKMATISDGAIVGSAILRKIHAGETVEEVADYVRSMKEAVMKAGK
jgi:tryptophan synthase alpha chain